MGIQAMPRVSKQHKIGKRKTSTQDQGVLLGCQCLLLARCSSSQDSASLRCIIQSLIRKTDMRDARVGDLACCSVDLRLRYGSTSQLLALDFSSSRRIKKTLAMHYACEATCLIVESLLLEASSVLL